MTSIGILGNEGRMGRAIAAAIKEAKATHAGGIGSAGDPRGLAEKCDVLIDFTAPAALPANLAAAQDAGRAIVIGTTGLTADDHGRIDAAAERIAVLQTGNTSLGIVMLCALVRQAAASLGSDWDVEIAEMHHRMKVDAPSGTALMLGEAAAAGHGDTLDAVRTPAREGHTGARKTGTIGFSALRGGTVAGDHMVVFAGEGERIELAHRAEDRMIFARGAVRAALWLSRQAPGRYTMNQVLGM
ncbi:4-hydroxy-tetrahydrodipicolinate reductase [Stakelama sp. CBK3Z-3]|uniref:4-hydroxy-tetrahydrodipicolinate reductase n=1 Tax=Stakelama flava TaxID=2860338 RepID=A0ABS6XNX7_9SPHN|nr:4-hydroxy-tetrahydrodipicolinate reductase [Stakelama flava]MBW4331930.1 4-hydroxy-tetrahydrodipicolinate reductase [Stakelama flava]